MAAEPAEPSGRRRPMRSVRARTAAAATLVVGLALVVASIGLVAGLQVSLNNYLLTAAELRANDVADVLSSGDPPQDLAVDDEDDVFVQVLDQHDRVVHASPNLGDEEPVVVLADGQSTRVSGLEFEDDEFIVVASTARTESGPMMVLVGRNTEVIGDTAGTVIQLLLVGIPALLLVTAAATWRLAARALAPVDAIRSEVDHISAADLSERVSVPPTGDEVARLATTMNAMLRRLEAAQQQQQRFVSGASHELRSPLASIRQHAEVALSRPEQTSTAELADVVLAEDLRLQKLVEDLLWLARGDENVLLTRRRPVDVDDVVLEELARLRTRSSLEVDSRKLSGGRTSGDPNLFRLLVRNLLDNAGRHAHTHLAVGLGEDGNDVVLTVDDDGDGIAAEQRERVFERFVRLDEARSRDAGGSGLGLSIAQEIVWAHDGTIMVKDSPLGGARFEVRVPAAE